MRISITTNDNSLKSGLFTTNINQDTKKKKKITQQLHFWWNYTAIPKFSWITVKLPSPFLQIIPKLSILLIFIHWHKKCIKTFVNITHWTMNYLTFPQRFVQIDDYFSTLLTSEFGASQDSILEPILFNLYVADVANNTRKRMFTRCRWYKLYRTCIVSGRHAHINSIEKDIHSISRWPSNTNLIFNSEKAKVMVILTPQMSKRH